MTDWRSDCIRSMKHALAPAIILFAVILVLYGAAKWTLSEAFQMYETAFEIIAFLLLFFYLLICVPCAVYSLFLAADSMIRGKKFLAPLIVMLLDGSMLCIWVYALRTFILTK